MPDRIAVVMLKCVTGPPTPRIPNMTALAFPLLRIGRIVALVHKLKPVHFLLCQFVRLRDHLRVRIARVMIVMNGFLQ